MRVDPLGNPIWTKTYGRGPGRSFMPKAEMRSCPSGYIIAGTVFSITEGGELGYLLRIDDFGNLMWMKFYSQVGVGSDFTKFNDVQHTASGFIVTGVSFSQVPPGMYQNTTETLVMTMDTLGNVIWAEQYPYVEGADSGESIIPHGQGYAVSGALESFGLPASQLFAIDSTGGLLWHKRLDQFIHGGYSIQDSPANGTMHQLANGDIVMEGGTFTSKAALLRFDSLGNLADGAAYGFDSWHYGSSSVLEPGAGGFTFTGASSDGIDLNYYMVRTDVDLNIGCDDEAFAPVITNPPVTPISLLYTSLDVTEEALVPETEAPLFWNEYIHCGDSDCIDPLPISCSVSGLNVTISWAPLPIGVATAEIWRNGSFLATVAGTSYLDSGAPVGTLTYELRLYDVDPQCDPAISSCTVKVGFSISVGTISDVIAVPWKPIKDDPIICWDDALVAHGRNPAFTTSIEDITPQVGSSLSGITPIAWVSLGTFPFTHRLTQAEGQALANFLAAGGSLYIEGGDVAFTNQTVLSQMDGVVAIANGDSMGRVSSLIGLDSGLGLDATSLGANYQGNTNSVDHLAADGNGAAPFFQNGDAPGQVTAVYYDASIAGNGTHRMITSSTLLEGYQGDWNNLIQSYLAVLSPVVAQTFFIRGDANGDGALDIGDPVQTLSVLFAGAQADCLLAQDSNDDGAVDIGDVIYALAFQFSGGSAPPQPFPNCGADPTPDSLACDNYTACP